MSSIEEFDAEMPYIRVCEGSFEKIVVLPWLYYSRKHSLCVNIIKVQFGDKKVPRYFINLFNR